MTAPAVHRFQFSLATVFCAITAVAILCLLTRWEGTFPYWAIVPALFFVAACCVVRSGRPPDLAWGFFAIAWSVALFDTCRSLFSCFAVLGDWPPKSAGPPASEIQQALFLAYGSGVALPLFLSLPTAYLAINASRCCPSRARRWLILCPLIGLVDLTVLTVSLAIFVGYVWP